MRGKPEIVFARILVFMWSFGALDIALLSTSNMNLFQCSLAIVN